MRPGQWVGKGGDALFVKGDERQNGEGTGRQ